MIDKDKKINAAVFGFNGNAYDIVDLLKDHNINTFLLDYKNLTKEKYPNAEIMLCPSIENIDDFVSFINTKVAPGEKVVLIPSSNEYALFLSRNCDKFDKRFLFCFPDASLLESLDNKMLFFELCNKHGISCPDTFIVRKIEDFENILEQIRYPVVVKPFNSRLWQSSIGYKVIVAHNQDFLRNTISKALSLGKEVIVQDMIPGGAKSDLIIGGLYDENSEPVKLYVAQKLLQHPLDVGAGCYVSLSWKQEAVDLVNRLAKQTGYRGLVDVDLKYDSRDETYKIIEVNPRNGLSHRISCDGQWDLLSFYVYWITGNKEIVKDFQSHEDDRKWIFPIEHMCSLIQEKGVFKGFTQWLKDMRQTKLRCAWNLKDFYRSWKYFRTVIGCIRRLNLRQLFLGRNTSTIT